MPALGVDLNGVIRESRRTGEEEPAVRQEIVGVVEGLRRANDEVFHGNVFIVSKSSREQARERSQWMNERRICERIGIPRSHQVFCAARDGKAAIAVQRGLTHVLDDRPECLAPMRVEHRCLFRPRAEELAQFPDLLPDVHVVQSMEEYLQLLGISSPVAT